MSFSRVIILHGFSADSHAHWFPQVAEDLKPAIHTVIPDLPDSLAPQPERWIEAAVAAIGQPDPETVVVGHSLGVLTGLLALDSLSHDWELGKLIAVSGFATIPATLPELTAFGALPLHVEDVAARIHEKVAVFSDNDVIVPPLFSHALAEHLGARKVEIAGGGHFLDREGFIAMPAVVDEIAGQRA